MNFVDDSPVTVAGESMAAELAMVHRIIRQDLVAVRGLAAAVVQGASGQAVRDQVAALAVSSPIWTLRVSCLRHCRFVHGHHEHEDDFLFSPMTQVNPALSPAVERLKREHQEVSRLLDDVERQADALDHHPDGARALSAALDELSSHLLAHLDWEEDALMPTLRRMTDWRT